MSKSNWTSFGIVSFQSVINEYFNFLYIEDNPILDVDNTAVVTNLLKTNWYSNLQHDGYKIISDLMWGGDEPLVKDSFVVNTPNWFWYHESLLYQAYDYHNYTPHKTYQKLALIPMGLIKKSHEMLYDKIEPFLDMCYWSYVERFEKYLPYDTAPYYPASKGNTGQQQRYFNPRWYDNTYFSLVSETEISIHTKLHITEKTFKPIAFYHPFLLWAQPGVLTHLKSLGFETYENLFDESYDQTDNLNLRLEKIINNVKNFQQLTYDNITIEKTLHNHNLFFNNNIIKQRIFKEIIEPILNWIETKQ